MIPTRENYEQYIRDREERTREAISKSNRISGRQVRDQNLSVKMICDAGYVLNVATDTLEKL